jgi:hypothetical protein
VLEQGLVRIIPMAATTLHQKISSHPLPNMMLQLQAILLIA